MLVDTHCHLPYLDHRPIAEIIADAVGVGVTRMICIGAGTGKQAAVDAIALAEAHPQVWASVGVHPHDAKDFVDLDGLEQLAAHPRCVAIGETGLDFFRDWAPVENQRRLFEATISFAKSLKKPLVIHSRSAGAECLDTLRRLNAADVGGVFHCYAEDAEFAKKLADINFLVSFPGTLTFKNAQALREIAKSIPLTQIMLETDAPYMAPEPYRGKPSEPMHVHRIAQVLAETKACPLTEISAATTSNAERLFGLVS